MKFRFVTYMKITGMCYLVRYIKITGMCFLKFRFVTYIKITGMCLSSILSGTSKITGMC